MSLSFKETSRSPKFPQEAEQHSCASASPCGDDQPNLELLSMGCCCGAKNGCHDILHTLDSRCQLLL